jgi:hypothetical protein
MDGNPQKELKVFRRRRETDDSSDHDGIEEMFDDDENDVEDEDRFDVDDVDDVDDDEDDDLDSTDAGAAAGDQPYAVRAPVRPTGPWDVHDVPDHDEVPRIDLGGILVPVPDGVELRVEVQDDVPVAATLVDGNSLLQVHAFAAPKSSGLWAEVRAEIADSLNGSGGTAEESEGPFGTELRARLPVEGGGNQPARFFGVDGPRWFLRGLFTGPGSTDPNQSKRLEEAFRQVVVNRGTEAMAPRDMLPLHLPREAMEMPPPPPEAQRSLELPERGPEITEIQ